MAEASLAETRTFQAEVPGEDAGAAETNLQTAAAHPDGAFPRRPSVIRLHYRHLRG